ncbi:hypothetical protein Anas_07183 [Armadillidium nasatum]|uniref:Uncharacterized protein n=1 Tax=Armadillidium nasatum TaxID=96803 RepID=A0A5N5SUL1_9CRUS|nr:hypothetical protein Anas_07183 [Armadillidium nasatum]
MFPLFSGVRLYSHENTVLIILRILCQYPRGYGVRSFEDSANILLEAVSISLRTLNKPKDPILVILQKIRWSNVDVLGDGRGISKTEKKNLEKTNKLNIHLNSLSLGFVSLSLGFVSLSFGIHWPCVGYSVGLSLRILWSFFGRFVSLSLEFIFYIFSGVNENLV